MGNNISNDALWEKLSEMAEKMDQLSIAQKSLPPQENQTKIKPDLGELKDDIITKVRAQMDLLGRHSQSHFDANRTNIIALGEEIRKILNVVSYIRKHQKETEVQPQPDNKEQVKDETIYFNFRFFQVRKSSVVIAVLALLVFILTLFSMKQQNDFALQQSRYFSQYIFIRNLQVENDSLKLALKQPPKMKNK
ncbi:hypothetical protein [Dysgonomonas sp. HDW5B]|uniref:hypothetical protein n=1 Tax=Dysgonomonas sp. HDW5B TaxID=2714927 RepID=UPI00162A7929|nr:hypothetical protein [Dysgonomonas sp. HDW5B]